MSRSSSQPVTPGSSNGVADSTANTLKNQDEGGLSHKAEFQNRPPRTVANAAKELLTRNESRSGASTPIMAKTAAEVADSAALLDREEAEPEISDEEAGRLGVRRLSSTPIPEVAKTAAEVADTARTLDAEVRTQ
jgi:hypothetical protein